MKGVAERLMVMNTLALFDVRNEEWKWVNDSSAICNQSFNSDFRI